MKALLLEGRDKSKNRSVLVLLPSGKIEPDAGDFANIALELEEGTVRAWIIFAEEVALFKVVREVQLGGRFLQDALEYRNVKIEYELARVAFKDRLQGLMLTPSSDVYSFLDKGSSVL